MKLIIMGAPRTLKNTPQAVLGRSASGKGQPCPYCKRPISQRVFPSKAWRAWVKEATITIGGARLAQSGTLLLLIPPVELESIDGRRREMTMNQPPARAWVPISEPVNCAAVFFRDRDQGDLIGFIQGLGDLLQERGVIADDVLLKSFDGSRLTTTEGRPRVEVDLTSLSPVLRGSTRP